MSGLTHDGKRAKVEVVEFSIGHAEALADFIRKVWDPHATAASVLSGREKIARENFDGAEGRIPTVLFLLGGEVVGHLTSIPERVSFFGSAAPIAWIVGFHVLPQHRNGPIGVFLAREMAKLAPNSMCSMVLDAPLKIFKSLGWQHLGTVPNQLLVIDGAEIGRRMEFGNIGKPSAIRRLAVAAKRVGAATLAAAAAGAAIRALALTAPRARGLALRSLDASAWSSFDEANQVWARNAPFIPAGLVRDGARVKRRFAQGEHRHVLFEARERDALLGWLILKEPRPEGDERLGGIRVAPISDLMYPFDRPEVAGELVRSAADYVRRTRFAHAVIASTTHRQTQTLLGRHGFLRLGGTLQLVAHPSILPSPVPPLEDWWHWRGDGDADSAF